MTFTPSPPRAPAGPQSLRAQFLDDFEPAIAGALANWMSQLRSLDADVLVFMARKSFCLYDSLIRLGVEGSSAVVVTDRVLDQRLDVLRGKRVALIDDTVILGTTLAHARERLEQRGCIVEVHAFCIDADFYASDIVELDSVQLRLTDDAVKAFCAAEVRAMMRLPRPYLVDFPVTTNIRIDDPLMVSLLSGIEWEAFDLTTPDQRATDVCTYTFFPNAGVREQLKAVVGSEVVGLLDLVKVRAFGRLVQGKLWFTIVPLVTLKPITEADARRLAEGLVDTLETSANVNLSALIRHLEAPEGFLRLAQYILSSALGSRFMRSMRTQGSVSRLQFHDRESAVHWGPWLRRETEAIIAVAGDVLWPDEVVASSQHPTLNNPEPAPTSRPAQSAGHRFLGLAPSPLPATVSERTSALFEDRDLLVGDDDGQAEHVLDSRIRLRLDKTALSWSGRVDTDVAEVFLALFQRYELPARREARRIAVDVVRQDGAATPFSDRLRNGVPWGQLAAFIGEKYELPVTEQFRDQLSLTLDRLNDLGIAVPITCVQDGVVFRAYRHGEDVEFQEAECNHAYELLEGLLDGAGWTSAPKLVVEKALVLLLRLGSAKRLLSQRFDERPQRLTARVTFHLHGAVTTYRAHPETVGGADLWLRDHLVRRGVFTSSSDRYTLGRPLSPATTRIEATSSAFSLGWLIGKLAAGERKGSRGVLQDDDLVALTTCDRADATLAALQAEVSIFCEWWQQEGRDLALLQARSNEQASLKKKSFRKGPGYVGIHSASKKCSFYSNRTWLDVVSKTRGSLDKRSEREWMTWLQPLLQSEPVVEGRSDDTSDDKLIAEFATLVWRIGALLGVIDTALATCEIPADIAQHGVRFEQQLVKFNQHAAGLCPDKPGSTARVAAAAANTDPNSQASQDGRIASVVADELVPDDVTWAAATVRGWVEHSPALERLRADASEARRRLDELVAQSGNLIELVDIRVQTTGRFVTARDYPYVVWYDVVDSRGERVRAAGGDPQAQLDAAAVFSRAANSCLRGIFSQARRNDADIFAWNGDLNSTNDEKRIAVTGKLAELWVDDVVKQLLATAANAGVHVRIIVVAPSDLTGKPLRRRPGASEPIGDDFQQHLAGAIEQVRALMKESKDGGTTAAPATTYVALVGNRAMAMPLDVVKRSSGESGESGQVVTRVGLTDSANNVVVHRIR